MLQKKPNKAVMIQNNSQAVCVGLSMEHTAHRFNKVVKLTTL